MISCNVCHKKFKNGAGVSAHQRFGKCKNNGVKTFIQSLCDYQIKWDGLIEERGILTKKLDEVDTEIKRMMGDY